MELRVVGITYQGFTSTYSYQVAEVPKDNAAAKRHAGDFQLITDFAVIEHKRTWRVTKLGNPFSTWLERTKRDWDNPKSAEMFARSHMD